VAPGLEHFAGISVAWTSIEEFQKEVVKGAEAGMEEFARIYFPAYPKCITQVVPGDAAEQIIHYIYRESIDLVVMGTHGRKGIERVLFGSVADRVIKTSPVPVLSINPYKVKGA
jgi:nucleotide-binding universal stress UspA family protein